MEVEQSERKKGQWFLVLFGGLFAAAGVGMAFPLLINPVIKTEQAKAWIAAPATVVSSKVESHHSDDGTTYSVDIAYRYTYNGTEFSGDRYRFLGGSSSGYDGKAEVVKKYPAGHAFEVFVDPNNPVDSIIRREYGADFFLGIVPLLFFGAGVAVMFSGFHKRKLDLSQARQQIVTLKGASPFSKATGIWIFAAIWNGVVVFLWASDAPLLFPIVFGFFGLIMIGASIHALLSLFNPRPIAEMSPGDIRPGTYVSLRWRMGGNSRRIQTFTARIKCLETRTETHRSGGKTQTRTVKVPIYEETFLETTDPSEIAQGLVQLKIPIEARPTNPSADPPIEWHLEFIGEIPRWPDIKEDFQITVYPTDMNYLE